jgi:hypothetical protein
MRKARILLFLGTWLLILPFLGFPYSWEDNLSCLTGLVIIYLSYLLYNDYKKTEEGKKGFDNFRENNDFNSIDDGKI